MGAAAGNQIRAATGAAIEREILARDAQRPRAAGLEAVRGRHRLPKHPQQATHLGIASGLGQELQSFRDRAGPMSRHLGFSNFRYSVVTPWRRSTAPI